MKPSVGGFLGNALNDVENIGSGLLALPGAVGKAFRNPQQGGQMIGNVVKNTAQEYNNLVGQPFDAKGNLQMPSISKAVSHAYEHPVDTALDVVPFVKPLQALGVAGKAAKVAGEAGKTAEEASILEPATSSMQMPKINNGIKDSQANMFLHGYTIPRQIASDVNPMDTARQMIKDGHSGTPTQLAQKFQPIVGSDGVIERIKRHVLANTPTNIDLSSPLKVTNDMQKTIPELVSNPKKAQVYSSELRNMLPMNQTADATANALDAYDSMRNIRKQGYDYISQGTDAFGRVTNAEKVNVGKSFLNAAEGIRDEINSSVKDNNLVDRFKTPAIQKVLQDFSPQFAKRYMEDTHNFSDLQGLQAPYVKMGQIIKHTLESGNTAASKVGQTMTNLGSTSIGAGVGGAVGGPIGSAVEGALGALAAPMAAEGVNMVLPKITSGIAKSLPKIEQGATIAKNTAKYGLPVIGAQPSMVGGFPSTDPENNQAGNNQNDPQHIGGSMTQFDTKVNSPASIPQSIKDINQNPDGTYGISNIYSMKDQTGKPLFISPDQIKEQQLKIDQAKNTLLYKNSQAEQVRVGSLQDQLNTQVQFSQQIQKPYETAQTKNNAYAQAILDAKAAGTSLANFNGTFDNFIKQISPQYADLATQLKVLESEGAINPNVIIKGSTLIPALQTAAQGNLMQFYTTLGNVVGYTGQQGGGVQTSANAPSPANVPSSNPPQGVNYSAGMPQGNNVNMQMPSIPNFQQIGSQFSQ